MFMRGSLEEARRLTYPFSPFPNTRGTCTLCIAAHSYVRGEGPVGAKGFSPGPLLNTSLKYFPPAITGAVAEIYSQIFTRYRELIAPPPGAAGRKPAYPSRNDREKKVRWNLSDRGRRISYPNLNFTLSFDFSSSSNRERKGIFISLDGGN